MYQARQTSSQTVVSGQRRMRMSLRSVALSSCRSMTLHHVRKLAHSYNFAKSALLAASW
jgi:hypothetical protein